MMSEPAKIEFPALPPYTYVPGKVPHPISDAAGHMFGHTGLPPDWSHRDCLRWGARLFDNGFYWESHEAWEHLWIKLGRRGSAADTVKGLIKLAACGVKCLEANTNGATRHAVRASELLAVSPTSAFFDDLDVQAIQFMAEAASQLPPVLVEPSDGTPQSLSGFRIL